MTKTPTNKANHGRDESGDRTLKNDVLNSTSAEIQPNRSIAGREFKSVANGQEKPDRSHLESVGELTKIEIEPSDKNSTRTTFQKLKAKTAAALIGSAVMLPILAVGSATYYFGSQAVDKQTILAKRSNDIDLAEKELVRQQKLLAILSIATGTTAILAGAIAVLITKRLIDSMSHSGKEVTAESKKANTQVYKFIDSSSQSVSQKDLLQNIVEEVRTYLNCDRVVVYSLKEDKQGTIIAESVASDYTQWLNVAIEDPFEAKYLEPDRDVRVKAIDDTSKVETSHRKQLEAMEVKASLVTPIVDEGNLFGLLVAHQCSSTREWQTEEFEFLHQTAQKGGLALKNARLLEDTVRLQAETERERKWADYLTDAVRHISQSIKPDDVLNISVEEVRRVLRCDRVIVHSLNLDDKYSTVIAESLSAGYPRTLNKTIENPFEAKYLDYDNGGVKAIDNIYEAEIDECYIKQLETLEVKASLVTPIFNEGKLFILVAHQCIAPRNWQQHEIRWVKQIATQIGFALDNARLLAASATTQVLAERERKWTNYLTDAIQYINRSFKQDDILNVSVGEVRRVLRCDRALVYSFNPNNKYGTVIAESVSAGYLKAIDKTIEDPCFEAGYIDWYRDDGVKAIDNIYEAGISKYYIEQLETLGVKASLVTPILNEGKLFGLLVAHQCSKPRNWQQYEIRWVRQIATQVGFALDRAKLLQRSKEASLPTQLLNNFSISIGERISRSQLLEIAVEQARRIIELDRVIVYLFDRNSNGIVAESVSAGYSKALNSQIKDPYFAREYEENRQGRIKIINDVERASLTSSEREQLKSLSVKASLVVPIVQNEQLFGLLVGHQCQQPRQWLHSEIDLFTQLALQLGLVLDRAELQEELDAAKNARLGEVVRQPEYNRDWTNVRSRTQESQSIKNKAALRNLKEKIDSSVLPTLPMEEITIEYSEAILEPIEGYDYDLDLTVIDNKTVPSLPPTNQFAGDLTNISDKISQQSSIAVDSFQKLAELAKQLSEDKKSLDRNLNQEE